MYLHFLPPIFVSNAEFEQLRLAALVDEEILAQLNQIVHEKAISQNEDGLETVIFKWV